MMCHARLLAASCAHLSAPPLIMSASMARTKQTSRQMVSVDKPQLPTKLLCDLQQPTAFYLPDPRMQATADAELAVQGGVKLPVHSQARRDGTQCICGRGWRLSGQGF